MPRCDEVGKWFKRNLGSCLSWAITIGWLIFIYFKIHNGILPINLNEFGDFIAGTFAPLAFFWLVRGFYQQGKGLEQNSDALKMQATELEKTTKALEFQIQEMKASVEQQTRMAKVYEEEMQQKHFQARPYFEYSFKLTENFMSEEADYNEEDNITRTYQERYIKFSLTIQNLGEIARSFIIKSKQGQPYIQKQQYKFEHLESISVNFEVYGQIAEELHNGAIDLIRFFKIKYQDIYGKEYEQYIACDVIPNNDDETGQVYLEERFRIISKETALARPI